MLGGAPQDNRLRKSKGLRSAGLERFAERAARRYRDRPLTAPGLTGPPRASLADGAAGVAYFLLRHATFGGDAASLEASAAWAAHAERARGQEGAFASGNSSSPSALAHSLYFGRPGVWWVRALIALAISDDRQARRSARGFADAAASASGAPGDVMSGSAGLLLGCAQLIEGLKDPEALTPVRAVGGRLAVELAAFAGREGATPGPTALGYLGAAHGWAGVGHALLRWSSAIGQPPPEQARGLLERLLAQRRPSGRWPVRAGSREVYLGWCHGSAGWAQLWTLAWQLTGEGRFLRFAADNAQGAVAAAVECNPSLCCGRAGQGFAALTLYRATGERRWLAAAHRVAADAVRMLSSDPLPAHQLFGGELGVALLIAELEDPSRAAMPIYQRIA
jgi:eukaryotic-like serine/threonine-protein kinase